MVTPAHKHIGAEPDVFAEHDGLRHERHAPAGVIVGAGAEMTMLAHVGATPEGNAGEIVEVDLRAEHGARARASFQGNITCTVGKYHLARRRNVGAEKPEQPRARQRWRGRGLQRNSVPCTNAQSQRSNTSRRG